MRRVLRRREIAVDDWRYLEELAGPDAQVPLIVTLAALRQADAWLAHSGPLGVRIGPTDPVEELAPLLPQLSLVAVEFPSGGDGRGYSQGRLLRGRLGFAGELRARGAGVRRDQVFLLARCGFDTLELAPGEDFAAAANALSRYDVAYQPGAAHLPLRRQRFGVPPGALPQAPSTLP